MGSRRIGDNAPPGRRAQADEGARMVWVSGVVLLAVLQYLVITMLVGRAPGRYGVKAPACTGDPMFERWFRVQQNSLEMLMAFIPAVWLYGWWVSPTWATGIGLVFVAGRLLYAVQYIKDPATRTVGAGVSFFTIIVLVVGGLYGIVRIAMTS
ncbi:MAG: MAPEG family protein [Gammaproteobacteria bacterium]